ncbi:MAG: energy-coupling factor transporter transmembrane protein EcfT [Chloroflexota bacterium]|nr:energy-coupling factor transporter transmembrane protein EcfT [Chloroflexota bacterium]
MSRTLDPRAWLVWMLAASLPALLGRNPFVLVATLLAVLGVRAVWGTTSRVASWRVVVRLAVWFAAIAVLFNLLTVHVGDRVIAKLPGEIPIIGGILTVNALVYGLLSGVALVTLVLIGTTVAAVLDWTSLLRLLPPRLTLLAVAGSVAWAMVPQTIAAYAEIREAQLGRGHRTRGVRGLVPLLVPLLAGGLERSFLLAEALEARGFGAQLATPPPWSRGRSVLTGGGLTAATIGAYLLAVGRPVAAIAFVLAGSVAFVIGSRESRSALQIQRTRYREIVWARPEWIITGAAAVVLAIELAVLAVDPAAFAYDPYPSLAAPPVNLPLLAALGFLLAPALVAP